ncbi:DUF2461 domain-containing protein [Clostridium saccharobutylicum]|uniref:TIGR02453 family protein n=1 Tax=Clostridium saccharobutylicum TaxID=169679 RepID=A0A1S8MQC0_CLOSA|nr:DUF2461 domain-containing protein [Clostridium saccharobutylicum]OOM06386.1 hypothetical protein CLOSAC_43060 [Clostridium saccharobutylicum]
MNKNNISKFEGFSPEALTFLNDVRVNNSKEWFESHRNEYNKCLLEPFQNLVIELSEQMLCIDDLIDVAPLINKTISRIFRDIRFSKDKFLYKNTMCLAFKRAKKEWRDAPAFFFEISPKSYRYGMGYYSASKESMDVFRKMIDENQKSFEKAISFFDKQNVFTIEGEEYKRTLDPTKTSNINQWYNRKSIHLVHSSVEFERIFTNDILKDLITDFTMLKPIYDYLCSVEVRKNKWINY